MPADAEKSLGKTFIANVVAGIGWVVGLTIGFTIVVGIIVKLFQQAGGLPLVGKSLQKIIQPTLDAQTKQLPSFTFPSRNQ